MSNKNLAIELHAKKDKNGKTFYVGKIKAPVLIDCTSGVTFLIFASTSGEEQLQISSLKENESTESF